MMFLHQDTSLLVVFGLKKIPQELEGDKGGKRQSKGGERQRAGYKERLRLLSMPKSCFLASCTDLHDFTGTKSMFFSNSSSSTTLRLLWTLMHCGQSQASRGQSHTCSSIAAPSKHGPSMPCRYFQELGCAWSGSERGLERRWLCGFLVAGVGGTWAR